MRVAVISRVFARSGGGAESYSVALVEQLAARHEIHVFAQDTNRPVTGVTYHRVLCLGRKPRWINQLVFAFASWWQSRSGFDVVHSHENTWHGAVQTIHVRPIRLNLLSGGSTARRFFQWLKIGLSPRLLTYLWLEGARFSGGSTRRLVASSENLRSECEQAYPACSGAVTVILPGTNLPARPFSRLAARQKLGLPEQGRWVLFIANDYERKGLDALLVAMSHLPADTRLMVVGNPRTESRYRREAQRLGVAQRVSFLGVLNDLEAAYWAADCLAHPTLEDSFAMVVLEAMAHGLPVVVSGPTHCGISRQLGNGVQALLLPDPKDAVLLAKLIASMLEQPELAQTLSGHGLAFAAEHSWEKAALQYEQMYSQVAAKR